jgi:hypothetical protein
MSTYYFLVCDKHKEYCDGASRSGSGAIHLCDSEITLPPFIVVHCDCPVRICSEHDESFLDYDEWNKENVEAFWDKWWNQP